MATSLIRRTGSLGNASCVAPDWNATADYALTSWSTLAQTLYGGWTPEQIAGRLRLEGSRHRISTESIYRFVYSKARRKDKLHRYLARGKAKRGYRARKGRTSRDDEAKQPIWLRPAKAHTRTQVGHWEGDCIHFRKQGDILLTLQDRKTRYWMMQKLDRRDAETTAAAIRAQLQDLPVRARRTITLDNGSEFARHRSLKHGIGLSACFCEPNSPWQRGSNENGNGRVRRDLRKKNRASTLDGP